MQKEAILVEFAPYAIGGVALIALFIYFEQKFGAGTPDPGGGAPSTGILSGILNATAEIGKSPISYTDAAQQTVMHPIDVTKSILGMDTSPTPAAGYLVRGRKYTFRFNCPRQSDPIPDNVAAYIQSWTGSSISQIAVTLPNSSELDVQFLYTGDGTDTIISQAAEIMNAIADSDSTLSDTTFASMA